MFPLYQAIRAAFSHSKNRESTPIHHIFAKFERSLRGFSNQIEAICDTRISLTDPDATRNLKQALRSLLDDLYEADVLEQLAQMPAEFDAIMDLRIEGNFFRIHSRPQARTRLTSDMDRCSFQPMEAENGLLTTKMTVARGPAKASDILCHSARAPGSLREALEAEIALSKDYEAAMQAKALLRRFPFLSDENIEKLETRIQRNSLRRQLSVMAQKDRKFLRANISQLLTPEGAVLD
jgi:hypothetical protein